MSDSGLETIETKRLELSIKTLEMVHRQIPNRGRMRDHVLLVYMATVGTIYGIASTGTFHPDIVLVVPFLTLGCTIIVSQHNMLISALINFSLQHSKEIQKLINEDEIAYGFYCSSSFQKHLEYTLCFRTFGHSIILLVPGVIALFSNNSCESSKWLFAWALICLVVSFVIIVFVTLFRILKDEREFSDKSAFLCGLFLRDKEKIEK
ncbi:MAG: hypothetical protein D3913_05010 [Candidatus Electrothrix sp. LOE1_4_5]|nr:hypothetical protein [Candidatus Electrothrix gigas]